MGYREVYEDWQADPEGFWMRAAGAIDWIRPPTRALDASRAPFYGWFPDAVCNTCYNAVDRHVAAGHGDRVAIIHNSPGHRERWRGSPMPSSSSGWRGWPARWRRAGWPRATG